MSEWRENSRCTACGYRRLGEAHRIDTLCPGCGTRASWYWQLWESVTERREGFWRRRWVQLPSETPFVPEKAEHRGGYIP